MDVEDFIGASGERGFPYSVSLTEQNTHYLQQVVSGIEQTILGQRRIVTHIGNESLLLVVRDVI